jgi:hypothetical protein
MTNGGHPPKKDAGQAGKKAKTMKPRKARPGAKPQGKLETLLQGRA